MTVVLESVPTPSIDAASKRREALLDNAPYLVTAITFNGAVLYQNAESILFFSDRRVVAMHGGAASSSAPKSFLTDLFSLEGKGILKVCECSLSESPAVLGTGAP